MRIHFLSLGILLFAGACHNKETKRTKIQSDTIPVQVISLSREATRQPIYASGQFTTDDETNLSFKNGGIISRMYVQEGDAVKKGQLIASLHLTEINAQVSQSDLALQKAQRDYERARNLYKDSVATLEQMQNAQTALDIARQQQSAAKFNQGYSEIRATADGYVLRKYANEGQVVGPGMPIVMVNGAGRGNWLLKAGVSDQQWAAIQIGDKAIVETDALPGTTINAVVWKKPEGIDASGTFVIQLKLQDKPGSLASGLFGKAMITPSQAVNAWRIPYDALLDGDRHEGYVFITNDNKTATKVKVTLGNVENNAVLVTGGLEHAHSLIVSGNAYLNDRSPITIQNTGKP